MPTLLAEAGVGFGLGLTPPILSLPAGFGFGRTAGDEAMPTAVGGADGGFG